ncbi:MAG: nucleotide pyrophosphohydrolase [Comamonadaceae bacterium]|nr:nucleotide pyrophosphohydrolase [Comamonadaceae bacterium]
MADTDIELLTRRLRRFAGERGWDRIDTPKNPAVAVLVEAAQLQEHFQWLEQEESFRPSASGGRRRTGDGRRPDLPAAARRHAVHHPRRRAAQDRNQRRQIPGPTR